MQKTLIVIGAGLESIPVLQRANEMGLHVVAVDANPQAPGFAHAHESVIGCVYTPEITVAALTEWSRQGGKPHGVICAAVDAPGTVAAVADHFRLTAVSAETARLATDKKAMKDRFSEMGIPIPWYQEIFSAGELSRILDECRETLVIKPVDSRGARGVLRLVYGSADMPDPAWAFECAKIESPTGRVMVEKHLDGPQISTEGFVVNGQTFCPGFSDRNYEFLDRFAPNIIENGGDLPSFLDQDTQQAVKDLSGKAAIALGIENSMFKGDMVVHNGKPYVIEMAARLSGGYFCSHEIPWNTGVDFTGTAIRLALGERPDPEAMTPSFQKGVAQRYLFPKPGKVVAIEGVETALVMYGICMVEIRTAVGETIAPATSHPARAGVVMAKAETREKAIKQVEAAVAAIKIITS
ncbi:phosphoribosylglycinamide synthetase [Maridesulfovibrio salexigens]|uniref:Phosphoribosylglycinamide synthetase n=1 Tax=Maridesulfovibrio salexigens (strain ATCC 14822 / DSM 2638 / NCIMB 8403 / VKM B-1763) TaxID=526222 RepID=C6BXS9_MARSD|nr:phosphoribosylglycinamide synthetase [Maridesulfovibrio salexigens]ACS78637.1 phosphoribosylglycinamide synthetase [Maridesulfovibrio salexigens DSM 2638]